MGALKSARRSAALRRPKAGDTPPDKGLLLSVSSVRNILGALCSLLHPHAHHVASHTPRNEKMER